MEEPSGMLGITHVQSASSANPFPAPELTLPKGRRLPPPDLSAGRQLMPPGKGQSMLLSSPSGPAHSSPVKKPPSMPILPLKGGQSSLQMTAGDGSLRNDAQVGDRPESENQDSTARNRTRNFWTSGRKWGWRCWGRILRSSCAPQTPHNIETRGKSSERCR